MIGHDLARPIRFDKLKKELVFLAMEPLKITGQLVNVGIHTHMFGQSYQIKLFCTMNKFMIPLTKGVIPNIQIHTNIPIYKSRWTYLYICEHLYIRDHSNSMKVTDVIFALICGRVIGFLVGDFLKDWGIEVGLAYSLVLWVLFPFASLLLLWIAQIIGRKLLFVYQAAQHLLVGAFATVIDLKFFEYLLLFVMANSL